MEYSLFFVLFLMMFMPFEQKYLKVILLVVVSILALIKAVKTNSTKIHMKVVVWFLFLITTGIFFEFWGVLNESVDALMVFPVFVIWPICYFIIFMAMRRIQAVRGLLFMMILSAFVISIYSELYILSMLEIIPSFFIFKIVDQAVVAVNAEFLSYFMASITSMLFLVPFGISAFMLWDDRDEMPIKRNFILITIIVSFGPIIFSQSRIFWVLLILAPALTLIFVKFLPITCSATRGHFCVKVVKKVILNIFFFFLLLVLVFHSYIFEFMNYVSQSDTFMSALTFTDYGSNVRGEQKDKLLEGWSNVPFLGAGHGASLHDYHSSSIAPWAYEQTFFALLFQTGIIGTSIYLILISLIVFFGLKIVSRSENDALYIIPLLVGMVCFLVANLSNPYLYAFDYLWTLFVPLMCINFFIVHRVRMCREG